MVKKVEETQMTAKEAEENVVSLANAGHSPSKIGLILRDDHDVKNFGELTGKTIKAVLKENDLLGDIPEDLLNLIRKSVVLHNHMEKNHKDYSAKRGYELTVSKIRKLSKYYVRKRVLPSDWYYSAEKAALLVK
ncbi:MAG: 30S ribosomal protein S15 [Candidatus Diapherotrites archaeon]|jgi:small subunit ribosomal protein S15|uniref:30S ribosomal protein S15 n=1 Tax=Candidatus Iainarchaeum sp. TaxID=3101447 RepID=A0A8T5GFA2_9ARCH|nr:30S ribosomal protein S15 [Candidatus Diapherotrites archaeon]MBT7241526.1 30S ribosomal protein S15 [Candidatus Diapherotrites archaeon]